MADTNRSTEDVIKEWAKARELVQQCEANLTSAKNSLNEAARKLGRHMTPGDARVNETFCIWASGAPFGHDRDVLLEVTVVTVGHESGAGGEYRIDVARRKGNRV